MTRSVSSWFIGESQKPIASVINRFTIAGSDYSDYVLQWPSFSRAWDDIRPREIGVQVSNADGTFNAFRTNPTLLVNSCMLETGFGEPGGYMLTEGGDYLVTEDGLRIDLGYLQTEYVTLLAGNLRRASFADAKATIYAVDKFITLSDKIIGTNEAPVDFTGSSYLASDLAWYVCTSYGGLAADASSSNPDIDYASFQEWAAVMSSNNILVQGYYDGQPCTEVLKTIAELTYTAIFDEDGRVKFKRFTVADSSTNTFDDNSVKSISFSVDLNKVKNRQYVSGLYDVTSKQFGITVTYQDSSSVSSYGAKEDIKSGIKTWLVNSSSCLDLAQRLTIVRGQPFTDANLSTTFYGIRNSIGDIITVTDSSAAFSDTFRLQGFTVDPNTGAMEMDVSRSQVLTGFVLDTSLLNGPDVLA